MMMIAGCGRDKDQSDLQISKNVEFGKTDYEKITDSNNQLGFTVLSEPNQIRTAIFLFRRRVYSWLYRWFIMEPMA